MPSIRSSLASFSLWFIIVTSIFGLLAMLVSQSGISFLIPFFSASIMLPYMIAFYLMTQHFIKKHQTTPQPKQRWMLSLGCLFIFWVYTFIAGAIGLWLSDIHLAQQDMGAYVFFILIFGGYLIGINLMLVLLGYFFLGKPAEIMLKHQQRS